LSAAESRNDPELALFAQAAVHGVDPDQSSARTELAEGKRPNLAIGLSFSMLLDNSIGKAATAQAQIAAKRAEFALNQVRDNWETRNRTLLIAAQSAWDSAKSIEDIKLLRSKAIDEMKRGFRQGRIGLDQVILATNLLTQAELEYATQASQFFIARDELLSHREQLLEVYRFRGQSQEP
jgi:outer membrane protein TolC